MSSVADPGSIRAAVAACLTAGKKSAVTWLAAAGGAPRLVWAGWEPSLEAVVLVTGGTEQAVPGLVDGAAVTLTVAAPSTAATVLTADGRARVLETGTPEWESVAGRLAERRLNGGQPADVLAGWRATATLVAVEVGG